MMISYIQIDVKNNKNLLLPRSVYGIISFIGKLNSIGQSFSLMISEYRGGMFHAKAIY